MVEQYASERRYQRLRFHSSTPGLKTDYQTGGASEVAVVYHRKVLRNVTAS